MVSTECLTMSNTEREDDSTSPVMLFRVASEDIEPETSTTQQRSTGVRWVPVGGFMDKST